MSPEIIKYLLSWAVFYTGYDMPAELPVIEYVPHSFFVQHVCYNVDTPEDPCMTRAAYDDHIDGVLFMDEKIYRSKIDKVTKGVVLHEIVHYLQDMSGDWKDIDKWQDDIRCQEREYRQREAYMMQDKYMLDVHDVRRLLPRHHRRCGN